MLLIFLIYDPCKFGIRSFVMGKGVKPKIKCLDEYYDTPLLAPCTLGVNFFATGERKTSTLGAGVARRK